MNYSKISYYFLSVRGNLKNSSYFVDRQRGLIPIVAVIAFAVIAVAIPVTVQIIQNPKQITDFRNRAMEAFDAGLEVGLLTGSDQEEKEQAVQEDDRAAAIADIQNAFPTEVTPVQQSGDAYDPDNEAERAKDKQEIIDIQQLSQGQRGLPTDTDTDNEAVRARGQKDYRDQLESCTQTRDCVEGFSCNNGKCIDERIANQKNPPEDIPFSLGFKVNCNTYRDCHVGYKCDLNSCNPLREGHCLDDRDCGKNENCISGFCKPADTQINQDTSAIPVPPAKIPNQSGSPDDRQEKRDAQVNSDTENYRACRAEGIPEADCQKAYPASADAPRTCTAVDCQCTSEQICTGDYPSCSCIAKEDRLADNSAALFGSCQSNGGECVSVGSFQCTDGIINLNLAGCAPDQGCCIRAEISRRQTDATCGSSGTCDTLINCVKDGGKGDASGKASCQALSDSLICCVKSPKQEPIPTYTPSPKPTPIIVTSLHSTCLAQGECQESPIGSTASCDGEFPYRCMPDGRWERILVTDPSNFNSELFSVCKGGRTGVDEFGCRYTCDFLIYQPDVPNCRKLKGETACYPGFAGIDENGCQWACSDGHWVRGPGCEAGLVCQNGTNYRITAQGKEEIEKCTTKCHNNECVPEVSKELACEYTGEKKVFPDGCVYSCQKVSDIPLGSLSNVRSSSGIYWNRSDPTSDASCGFRSNIRNAKDPVRGDKECRGDSVITVARDSASGAIVQESNERRCFSGCRFGACYDNDKDGCIEFTTQFSSTGKVEVCLNGQWTSSQFQPKVITGESGLTVKQKLNLYGALTIMEKGMGEERFANEIRLNKVYVADYIVPKDKELINQDIFDFYSSINGTITYHSASLHNNSTTFHELIHSIQYCGYAKKQAACQPVLLNWAKKTGWNTPDPNGSGQTNLKPADLPTDYSRKNPTVQEDMAESLTMYLYQPCDLLRISARRYQAAQEFLNNLKNAGCKKQSILTPATISLVLASKIFAKEEERLLSQPILLKAFELIVPGKTTKEEVTNLVGEPFQTYQSTDGEVLWYRVENSFLYHTIILHNDIVWFMTIHLPDQSSEVVPESSKPDLVTYTYTGLNHNAYIYLKRGKAYIVDSVGRVLIKQKFIPQGKDKFLNTWGKEYPLDYPDNYEKFSMTVNKDLAWQQPFARQTEKASFAETMRDLGSSVGLWIKEAIKKVFLLLDFNKKNTLL